MGKQTSIRFICQRTHSVIPQRRSFSVQHIKLGLSMRIHESPSYGIRSSPTLPDVSGTTITRQCQTFSKIVTLNLWKYYYCFCIISFPLSLSYCCFLYVYLIYQFIIISSFNILIPTLRLFCQEVLWKCSIMFPTTILDRPQSVFIPKSETLVEACVWELYLSIYCQEWNSMTLGIETKYSNLFYKPFVVCSLYRSSIPITFSRILFVRAMPACFIPWE